MGKNKKKGEKDTKVLRTVRASVPFIPLFLKLSFTMLKYKRAAKKRRKIFKKTLVKEGLEKEVAKRLSDELEDVSIRKMVSEKGGDLFF